MRVCMIKKDYIKNPNLIMAVLSLAAIAAMMFEYFRKTGLI